MAEIDCSVTVNFLREWRRYCGDRPCGYCDFSEHNECGFPACQVKDHPDKAVEIIQKWSDEHPQKTRLDDLLEKYPKAQLDKITGCPTIRPAKLGYCDGCFSCSNTVQTQHSCWHEPLDGGATGKAVE